MFFGDLLLAPSRLHLPCEKMVHNFNLGIGKSSMIFEKLVDIPSGEQIQQFSISHFETYPRHFFCAFVANPAFFLEQAVTVELDGEHVDQGRDFGR